MKIGVHCDSLDKNKSTKLKKMKTITYIAGSVLLMASLSASAQDADQNPNWRNSAEKYATQAADLTATQSTTVQNTYEAYDFREAKAKEKQQRLDRRYNLKTMRIQSRYNYYRPGYGYGNNNQNNWNNGCYNSGYNNNNGWNNGSFGNNGYGNNGFGNNGYGNNNFGYWGKPNYTNLLLGAGLGVGLYYLLH